MLTDLNRESKEAGLQMNASKTKLMTNVEASPVRIDNAPVEICEGICVLGANAMGKEIKRLMALAWGKFHSLGFILKDKSLSHKIKFNVLES